MSDTIQNWRDVACPYCHAAAGSDCVDPPGALLTADRTIRPHPMRQRAAEAAARRAAEAAELQAERRKAAARAAKDLDSWDEDDPTGKKRQRLVRWLLRKGCSLPDAKIIAVRKYPR